MKILILIAIASFACVTDPANEESPVCYNWPELSNGQPLGKRIVIAVPPTGFGEPRPGSVDMLQLDGKRDALACQVTVTLLPPQYVPMSSLPGGSFPQNIQTITGERYNDSLLQTPPPANFVAPPAIAIVRWGVGGVQSIAEVDFSNGAVVNLTATFVRVSAFVDLPSQSLPEGAAVVLGGFIGPGWAKGPNAQRTYDVLPLLALGYPEFSYGPRGYFLPAPGNPGMYPVPAYGKLAMVYGTDPNVLAPGTANTLDANLIFYRDVQATILAGSFHVTNDRPGPIYVPNGAMYWSVQNNVAISQQLSVAFDLGI